MGNVGFRIFMGAQDFITGVFPFTSQAIYFFPLFYEISHQVTI